jgi:hypothetical protein
MLPSIDAPTWPTYCLDCGEELVIVAPSFCGACDDRKKADAVIDYRFRLDMDLVKARTREHLKGAR